MTTWIRKINEARLKAFQAKRPRRRTRSKREKMLMSCPEWRAHARPIAATLSVRMLLIAKLPHSSFFQLLLVRATLLMEANQPQQQLLITIQHQSKTRRIKNQLLLSAGPTRQTLGAALNSKDKESSGHRSPRNLPWVTNWRTWSRRTKFKVSRSLRKC